MITHLIVCSVTPMHNTSFVLVVFFRHRMVFYTCQRQDFSNLDILTGLSRLAFQQVKRNDME